MKENPDSGAAGGQSGAWRVDGACLHFEAAWTAGQRPRIEDFLETVAAAERPPLLGELLHLELEYRRRGGEGIDLHEYRARFPEHTALVEEVFATAGVEQPLDTQEMLRGPVVPPSVGTEWPQVPGYEVLGVLGKGGMGVVYKARQVGLERLVALKMILHAGHAGAEERQRFRTEAEAVARLTHPHIVQIHEVGEHQGLPYFSLEFCAGGSLDQKLNGTPQAPREAAQLVEVLAGAVDAAHRQGIVHRDLKPANVLLTQDGQPKITDFGLAKKTDTGVGQTQSGAILGTPSYMAPEQAAGKNREVGPAADVYALGAILYEMLTGRPPFKAVTPLDTLVLVMTEEPVPPRRLQPAVPRDLETICLKCLHKEPARRYAGALALAEDLQRFLRGEPIYARPLGRSGRLWRWCRRKPLTAGLIAALLLVGLLGLAGMTYLWRLAEARLARADRESARARRAVNEFFTKVSDNQDLKNHGLEEFRKQLLATARDYYDEFVQDQDQDPGLQAERGGSYRRLARITAEIGSQPEAILLHEKARDIFEALAGAHPGVAEYRYQWARSFTSLALLYLDGGRIKDAEAAFHSSLRLLDRLTHDNPENADFRNEQAFVFNNLGIFYRKTDEPAQARQAYEKARDVLDVLAREYPDAPQYRGLLAAVYSNLGNVYKDLREVKQAGKAHRQALDIQDRLVRDYPRVPAYRDNQANFLNNLGTAYQEVGELGKAEEAIQKAFRIWETLAREHPDIFAYQAGLFMTYHNLARVYGKTRRPDQALKAYQKALDLCGGLADKHTTVPGYRSLLAQCHNNLGTLHHDRGRWALAQSSYQEALKIRKALVEENPDVNDYAVDLSASCFNLGNLNRDTHHPQDAENYYKESLKILDRLVGGAVFVTRYQKVQGSCWHNLALVYRNAGRTDEAVAAYRRAIDVREALVRRHPGDPELVLDLGPSHLQLGLVLVQSDQPLEALEHLNRALDLVTDAPQVAVLWGTRASALDKLRQQALDRARKGQHEWAAHAAAALAGLPPSQRSGDRYGSACVYALCAAAAARDEKATPAERKQRSEDYAARGVAVLARAGAAGYFASADRWAKLQTDPDLEALRPREDFRKLQTELALKQKPVPP
jgi:tetratricopeptide (TPR) repeat protein